MLDLFFSFSGRIGRLRYFLTALASTVLVGTVAIVAATSISWKHPAVGVLALVGLAFLVVIATLWSSLSLQVRRVRDIGWDPLLVVAGNFALQVLVNIAILATHRHLYALSVPVTLGYSGILLFWPGQGPAAPDYETIFGGGPELPRQATRPTLAMPTVMPVAASRMDPPAAVRRRDVPADPPRPSAGARGLAFSSYRQVAADRSTLILFRSIAKSNFPRGRRFS